MAYHTTLTTVCLTPTTGAPLPAPKSPLSPPFLPLSVEKLFHVLYSSINGGLTSSSHSLSHRTPLPPSLITGDPLPIRNAAAVVLLGWSSPPLHLDGQLPHCRECSRWRPLGVASTVELPWAAWEPVPGARWPPPVHAARLGWPDPFGRGLGHPEQAASAFWPASEAGRHPTWCCSIGPVKRIIVFEFSFISFKSQKSIQDSKIRRKFYKIRKNIN
jgi:hypothetical protein